MNAYVIQRIEDGWNGSINYGELVAVCKQPEIVEREIKLHCGGLPMIPCEGVSELKYKGDETIYSIGGTTFSYLVTLVDFKE